MKRDIFSNMRIYKSLPQAECYIILRMEITSSVCCPLQNNIIQSCSSQNGKDKNRSYDLMQKGGNIAFVLPFQL
jgi:hypothetical protein